MLSEKDAVNVKEENSDQFARYQKLLKSLESERFALTTLFDNIPDFIFQKDRESRYMLVNRSMLNSVGLSDPKDMIGKTDLDLVPEEFAQKNISEDRRVIETAQPIENIEKQVVSPFGSMKWVLTTKVPILDETGHATGIMGISRDITERKVLEAKNNQLAMMVEFSADSIVGLDVNQKITVWNRGAENLYGYTAAEMIGAPNTSVIPPELEDETWLLREEVIRSGQVRRLETTRLCKDGSRINVAITLSAIFDSEGKVVGITSTGRDITKRKRGEEALRNSERKLADIIDFLPDATFAIDKEGRVIIWNKAIVRMTGIPAVRMIGKGDHAGAIPFYGEPRLQLIDYLLMGSEDIPEQYSNIALEGDTMSAEVFCKALNNNEGAWVFAKVSPLHDQAGNIIGAIESIRDITERKRIDEEYLGEKELTETLLESLPGIFYLYSYPELRLVRWNKAHETIFGFSPEEMKDRSILEWHLPENKEKILTAIMEVRDKGVGNLEAPLLTKDGRLIPFLMTVVTFEIMKGKYLMGVGLDISSSKNVEAEKVKLEEKFQQVQKMESVGRLAGGIAHDFNNLLTVIIGYCDILFNRLKDNDLDAMVEIRNAAQRAATLTGQLLAFSRRQILQPQAISLPLTIMNMQMMLKRLIGEDVEISVKASGDTWLVLLDPGKLEQVVMNLAVNARDAMPFGGKLTIETSNVVLDSSSIALHPEVLKGEYVLLAVSDSGQGIHQSVLPHIFEPFFTTKEIGKGTGLGLATVYGIIKQSNGYIFCYSELGKGTTFKIYLPRFRDKIEIDATLAASVSQSPGGKESILLVEDDEEIRGLVQFTLNEAGYSVVSARNGIEALAALTDRINLLLTDVVMPGMDGSKVAEQVAERYPSIKVLYMSGYTDDIIVPYGVLDKVLRLLQKPFSAVGLLRAVRETLDLPPN